jgi:hypothetical protein
MNLRTVPTVIHCCFSSSDKSTYLKSLLIKASAKCPKCKWEYSCVYMHESCGLVWFWASGYLLEAQQLWVVEDEQDATHDSPTEEVKREAEHRKPHIPGCVAHRPQTGGAVHRLPELHQDLTVKRAGMKRDLISLGFQVKNKKYLNYYLFIHIL